MEKSERQKRTSNLRRIELIVWLIILTIFCMIGIFIHIKHENTFEMHNIYMPDVDGLIVGSPVYIMGIPIGYVTKTKIINDDEVKVRFKLTNKDVHIPRGTFATVEFNGLGGSKSLQLYPPNDDKKVNEGLLTSNTDYILVERPKRLRDASALLYEMYKTLMNIIYTVTIFGHEVSNTPEIKLPNGSLSESENFLDIANKYIDTTQSNLNKIRDSINKISGGKYDWRK